MEKCDFFVWCQAVVWVQGSEHIQNNSNGNFSTKGARRVIKVAERSVDDEAIKSDQAKTLQKHGVDTPTRYIEGKDCGTGDSKPPIAPTKRDESSTNQYADKSKEDPKAEWGH
ncbi:hypothetical protein CIHG_07854 [Coccidioides immitis H538.4]|uniref:Uncharacterized protein n=1 Tax=Coccidioides immitis H538.4 TaxID=396776 RepID=A0A0J8RYZ2_COCIT|nr:hypothetical protein CIHG_07854 [Coccidioides immitis H538.4]